MTRFSGWRSTPNRAFWSAAPTQSSVAFTAAGSHGPGYIDYTVDSLVLTPATYLVSAAITDITLLHVFDYRDRAFTLAVQPGKSPDRNGVVTLDGHWAPPISRTGTELSQ